MSSRPDPSFDQHLHAAHMRHERELDAAEQEALTECEHCEERHVYEGRCDFCGAKRCNECGVMAICIADVCAECGKWIAAGRPLALEEVESEKQGEVVCEK